MRKGINKKLDRISWRMADYLEDIHDGSVITVRHILIESCGAKEIRDQEGGLYFLLDDEETMIDEPREMLELENYFYAEAEERGYLFDNISNWGKKLGQPYNQHCVLYRLNELVRKVSQKQEWLLPVKTSRSLRFKKPYCRQITLTASECSNFSVCLKVYQQTTCMPKP